MIDGHRGERSSTDAVQLTADTSQHFRICATFQLNPEGEVERNIPGSEVVEQGLHIRNEGGASPGDLEVQ